jgi:hypothetical protein
MMLVSWIWLVAWATALVIWAPSQLGGWLTFLAIAASVVIGFWTGHGRAKSIYKGQW